MNGIDLVSQKWKRRQLCFWRKLRPVLSGDLLLGFKKTLSTTFLSLSLPFFLFSLARSLVLSCLPGLLLVLEQVSGTRTGLSSVPSRVKDTGCKTSNFASFSLFEQIPWLKKFPDWRNSLKRRNPWTMASKNKDLSANQLPDFKEKCPRDIKVRFLTN